MSDSGASAARRQYVLGGLLVVIAAFAAVVLFDVLGTVFFAFTVAFILAPLRRRLRARGLSRLTSTVTVTGTAIVGVLAAISPLVFVLFVRFNEAIVLLRTIPRSVTLDAFGLTYEFALTSIVTESALRQLASGIAAEVPVLLVKFALFGVLVFSTLHNQRNVREGALAVVPPRYRDISESFHECARETLFAIYVLQAVTAVSTFFIAAPVFFLFGYSSPIALATVAGLLQFVPILGPSILVVALAAGQVLAGEVVVGVALFVVGIVLIAGVPDVIIRPRLASRTTDLSGSLYFIGFVGGLLSLGAIGFIVGPLVVALLVEAARLVAAGFEKNTPDSEPPTVADSPVQSE